jgi:hypothetical protein
MIHYSTSRRLGKRNGNIILVGHYRKREGDDLISDPALAMEDTGGYLSMGM